MAGVHWASQYVKQTLADHFNSMPNGSRPGLHFSAGGPAFEKLVGDGAQKQSHANDGIFEIAGNADKNTQMLEQRKHRRSQENSGDGSFAASEATAAEHGPGDGI